MSIRNMLCAKNLAFKYELKLCIFERDNKNLIDLKIALFT